MSNETLPVVQAESRAGRFHIVGDKLYVIFDVPGTGLLGKVDHSEYLTVRDGKFVTGICGLPLELNMIEPLLALGESRPMSKEAADKIAEVERRVDNLDEAVANVAGSGLAGKEAC